MYRTIIMKKVEHHNGQSSPKYVEFKVTAYTHSVSSKETGLKVSFSGCTEQQSSKQFSAPVLPVTISRYISRNHTLSLPKS